MWVDDQHVSNVCRKKNQFLDILTIYTLLSLHAACIRTTPENSACLTPIRGVNVHIVHVSALLRPYGVYHIHSGLDNRFDKVKKLVEWKVYQVSLAEDRYYQPQFSSLKCVKIWRLALRTSPPALGKERWRERIGKTFGEGKRGREGESWDWGGDRRPWRVKSLELRDHWVSQRAVHSGTGRLDGSPRRQKRSSHKIILDICQRGRVTSVETPKSRFHGLLSRPPLSDVSRRGGACAARPPPRWWCLASCVLPARRSRCFRSAVPSSVGVTGRIFVSVVFFVSISPDTAHRRAYTMTHPDELKMLDVVPTTLEIVTSGDLQFRLVKN